MIDKISAIIHLDGVDKSGKTTIRKKLIEKSDGRFLIIDRSYLSQVSYAKIYGRKIDYNFFYNEALRAYKANEFFFYLKPKSLESLQERYLNLNEKDLEINDYEKHIKIFDKFYSLFAFYGINYKIIDTSSNSIEQCVDEIINEVLNRTLE